MRFPSAKEAGRETSSGRVGQAQGGEPEGQRTSWPSQDNISETGSAKVIIQREGVFGFAKGRERGHNQRPAVHACQVDDNAGANRQEQRIPIL